jgi:hypothetical protein
MSPSGHPPRSTLAAGLVAGVALLSGCDDGVTPSLHEFRLDGQSPDSPTVLLLSTGFTDGDGDLSGGEMESFIDGRPTSAGSQPLLPMFLLSDVPESATEGRLEFVLELNVTSGEAPPPGTTFRLGVRVTDESLNPSATREITLRLD